MGNLFNGTVWTDGGSEKKLEDIDNLNTLLAFLDETFNQIVN